MNSRLKVLLVTAAAFVGASVPLHPVEADEPDISTVILTSPDDSSTQSMVITFDEPTALSEVEAELAPVVGDLPSEVEGDTLIIETEPSDVVARPIKSRGKLNRMPSVSRRGSYGSNHIYCGINYGFSNFDGKYGIQRACGVRSAPWYFDLADYWQATVVGGLSERGMKWWRNGYEQPMNAPHPNYPASYIFHGAYTPVGNGDFVYWEDVFTWRHNMGSGGNAELSAWGSLAIKGQG